jgi:hypothetical protein
MIYHTNYYILITMKIEIMNFDFHGSSLLSFEKILKYGAFIYHENRKYKF